MKTSELVSFNSVVLRVGELLELEGAELDRVLGGLSASIEENCRSYIGDCPSLVRCETFQQQSGPF